jgi:hypothetical protein
MLLSISRRTDIPAYYSDWLFKRISEGFVVVRNPMNPGSTREISLRQEDVDGIVFWSKNPKPMLGRLDELSRFRYYFQFTLTPYGKDVEAGIPDKAGLIDTFKQLADVIGPDRVIWRYDPILLNPAYPIGRHVETYAQMASALRSYTGNCTISFIDMYKNTSANADKLALAELDDSAKQQLARAFAAAASENGIALATCAEDVDLSDYGIGHARCVDAGLFNALWGLNLPVRKDRNQRPACRCTESTDIGAYNTCPGGCLYCYANYNSAMIDKKRAAHDEAAPLL